MLHKLQTCVMVDFPGTWKFPNCYYDSRWSSYFYQLVPRLCYSFIGCMPRAHPVATIKIESDADDSFDDYLWSSEASKSFSPDTVDMIIVRVSLPHSKSKTSSEAGCSQLAMDNSNLHTGKSGLGMSPNTGVCKDCYSVQDLGNYQWFWARGLRGPSHNQAQRSTSHEFSTDWW